MHPQPDRDRPGWLLCEAIFRLVAVRGLAIDHRMLVVAAPDRRVAAQINGLASEWDGKAGFWRPVPIGHDKSHRLRVYLTGCWHWQKGRVVWAGRSEAGAFYLPVLGTDGTLHADLTPALQSGLVDVAAGLDGRLTGHDVEMLMVKAMIAAASLRSGDRTDRQASGLAYPALGLGPNSNSVAATLRRAMGLPVARRSFGGWAPGYGAKLGT
jgi:hypothetical protein